MRAKLMVAVAFVLSSAPAALPQPWSVTTPPKPEQPIPVLTQKEILKGLDQVCVLVEDTGHSFEKQGVTRRKIKADVEAKLGDAGIRVSAASDCFQPPFLPHLRIVLMGLPAEPSLFAALLSVELREPVTLTRKSAERGVAFASVWEKNMLLVLSPDKVPTLRAKAGELLDNFLDDYRKANPSRRGQK